MQIFKKHGGTEKTEKQLRKNQKTSNRNYGSPIGLCQDFLKDLNFLDTDFPIGLKYLVFPIFFSFE
jgi:hypothetical protein